MVYTYNTFKARDFPVLGLTTSSTAAQIQTAWDEAAVAASAVRGNVVWPTYDNGSGVFVPLALDMGTVGLKLGSLNGATSRYGITGLGYGMNGGQTACVGSYVTGSAGLRGPVVDGTGWQEVGAQFFGVAVWADFASQGPPPFSMATVARTSNVVTVGTDVAHGFFIGDTVAVDSVDTTFAGKFVITTVPTSTTFTYAQTAANVTSKADNGDTWLTQRATFVTTTRARSGTTVTLTFNRAHDLKVRDSVRVAGVGGTGYNGHWLVLTVPSSTTITYACDTSATETAVADTGGSAFGSSTLDCFWLPGGGQNNNGPGATWTHSIEMRNVGTFKSLGHGINVESTYRYMLNHVSLGLPWQSQISDKCSFRSGGTNNIKIDELLVFGHTGNQTCAVAGAVSLLWDPPIGAFSWDSAKNIIDGLWFEAIAVPANGALIRTSSYQTRWTNVQFWDCTGAAGSAYVVFERGLSWEVGAPANRSNGSVVWDSIIPEVSSTKPEWGLIVKNNGVYIEGPLGFIESGFAEKSIRFDAGAKFNSVQVTAMASKDQWSGTERFPIHTDNSGTTNNTVKHPFVQSQLVVATKDVVHIIDTAGTWKIREAP